MESPISYWESEIDVSDQKAPLSTHRNTSLNIWDPQQTYRVILRKFADKLDANASMIADFSVRIYIRYLQDEREDVDLEVPSNPNELPPKGWFLENRENLPIVECPILRDNSNSSSRRQFTFQTADFIHPIVNIAVLKDEQWESVSDFNKRAVTFVFDEYYDNGDLLGDRPSTADTEDFEEYLDQDFDKEELEPLVDLFNPESKQQMFSYFIQDSIPDRGYNKTELSERIGISTNGIRRHIDPFVEAGILRRTTSEDAHIKRYTTNDNGEVLRTLRAANLLLKQDST